jgi:hypothetical protein
MNIGFASRLAGMILMLGSCIPAGGSVSAAVLYTSNNGVQSGAALTIIDAHSAAFPTTVLINSEGVAFGDLGEGFTITGGNVNGLMVFNDGLTRSNINKIVDNVDLPIFRTTKLSAIRQVSA